MGPDQPGCLPKEPHAFSSMGFVEWTSYQAVLFDLDGVLTPTAQVHMRAWSEMFNAFLTARRTASGDQTDENTSQYTDADYFAYVDGRPRYDGVAAFLASRGITLPLGEPADPPGMGTVCALGNLKNDAFNAVLARDGVTPYPGSVALLDFLAGLPIRLGVVTSSANARSVLTAAGLLDRFEIMVDGLLARSEGLAGKPAPDTYLHGARLLGAPAGATVVVEDAISGVAAGRAGDFGLVLGVDRGTGAGALLAAGADLVVADLSEVVP